jgi:O-antigen ligase
VTAKLASVKGHWSLGNFVLATYTLFLAGFFFVPNAVDLYKYYIALVFLPGLWLMPGVARQAMPSPIWVSVVAYIAYMLASSLWSTGLSGEDLWRDARYALYILGFILLTVYFQRRDPRITDRALTLVSAVVVLAALVSILLFDPAYRLPELTEERLAGLGIANNMNPSAFMYGLFGVVALDRARRYRGSWLCLVFAFGYAVIALFTVLTQSNTALLALITSSALLLLLGQRHSVRSAALGLGFAGALLVYLAWSLGLLHAPTDLGFTLRFPIWQHVLEQWSAAPVFGNGYQKEIFLTPRGFESTVNYAHSLFLGTLRDGGLVGFLLLLTVYLLALAQGLRTVLARENPLYFVMFVFGLVVVLVDTDQALTRPKELWIVLWLPLAYLIAAEVDAATDRSGSEATILAPEENSTA